MSGFLKYNKGLSRSQLKIIKCDGTTDIFQAAHMSGNVDVILNGIFLIPQITSFDDISGQYNLNSGEYDFRSGNYDTQIPTFTANETAQLESLHVKLEFIPDNGSIIMIRTY